MLFNSFEFLLFFPIVTVVYFLIPKKIRYVWLLLASYYFYMSWNYKYVVLLLFSTLTTYISALLVEKLPEKNGKRKFVIAGCAILNVGLLVYFKYSKFLIQNINTLLSLIGKGHINSLEVILPVGISFYIFQALSYVLDVNARRVLPEKNILKYALFISFFPQLVAGPIERSCNLLKQIQNVPIDSKFSWKNMTHGITVMLWGFFIKMVIADRIAIFVDAVFNNYVIYGTIELALAAIGFAIQIYCDFSGYSLIAIGCARILGFSLMDNFNAPYFSASIKEFWRRWHISLSTWFRDYIYIPLGGSRQGKIRKWLNVLITMGISGLWHGARWSFVAWGLLHGIYQVVEDIMSKPIKITNEKIGTKREAFSYKFLKRMMTAFFVVIAWIFFRADGLKSSLNYLFLMFTRHNVWVLFDKSLYDIGLSVTEFHVLFMALLVLVIVDYVQYRYNKRIDVILAEQNIWFRYVVLIILFTAVWVFGIYGPSFDSNQFIYFQF